MYIGTATFHYLLYQDVQFPTSSGSSVHLIVRDSKIELLQFLCMYVYISWEIQCLFLLSPSEPCPEWEGSIWADADVSVPLRCQTACFASRPLEWSRIISWKSGQGELAESTMTSEDSGEIRVWVFCLTWKTVLRRNAATAHLFDSLCSEPKGSTHWVTGTIPNDHGRVVCLKAFIVILWFATVPCVSQLPSVFLSEEEYSTFRIFLKMINFRLKLPED